MPFLVMYPVEYPGEEAEDRLVCLFTRVEQLLLSAVRVRGIWMYARDDWLAPLHGLTGDTPRSPRLPSGRLAGYSSAEHLHCNLHTLTCGAIPETHLFAATKTPRETSRIG